MSRHFKFGTKLACGLFIVQIVLIGYFVMPALASSRFVNHGDGTITDTETGLMWAVKDNGDLINWQNAGAYCLNYQGGGYSDWRMPTLSELASLYEPGAENEHGYHVNKMIALSAASCWASETRNNEAARFNFTYGEVYWLYKSFSGPSRVLPVRSSK